MLRLVLASCSIALTCACGGTQTTDDAAPGSVPPPRTEDDGPPLGSTLGGSKGGGSSSGSSGKPPSSPGAAGYGFVAVRTVSGDGTSAVARFFDEADPGDGLGPDGCRVDPHPDPASVPDIGVSAGDISITMGTAVARLTFRPFDGGYQEQPINLTGPVSLGTTMGASAIGATAPGFIGPIKPVPEPVLLTSASNGIADAPFEVAWSSIPNATKITVKLDGAVKTVTCSVDAPATHLIVPQARVAEVISQPAALESCASCLKLTLTGSSHVPIDADDYAISLRHESSVSAALAVH